MDAEPRDVLFTCRTCGTEQPTGIRTTAEDLAVVQDPDDDTIVRSAEAHRCRAIVDEETGATCDAVHDYEWTEFRLA